VSYPAYAETKPSGVDWLGDVPAHWEVKRLKLCTRVIDEKLDSVPVGARYVGMENIESNTGRLFFNDEQKPGEGACIVFHAGDVLFGKLRPYLAKATLAEADGVCTTEILTLRPHGVNNRFLLYYLLSDNVVKVIDSSTYGVKMPRASWDFIGNLAQVLPPLPEQQQIAAFLDRKTAELDAVLRLKERQLELLAEKRQALISQAVTRGLDPTALLKASGIPWMGKVPGHWEVKRLKFLTYFVTSGSRGWAEYYSDDGAMFIRIGNLTRHSIDLDLHDLQHVKPPRGAEGERTRVMPDDVLVSVTAFIGSIAVVPPDLHEAYVNQHIALARPRPNIVPKWLGYCLLSGVGQKQLEALSNGGTKEGLGLEDVSNLAILYPPLAEQQAIVAYLNRETARMDGIARAIRAQIGAVREYRQALLSAAVTGKIDVRGEAGFRQLPEAPGN